MAGNIVPWCWEGAGQSSTTLFYTFFDERHFDISYFAAAELSCPASIARSVRKRQAEFFYGRACARAALSNIGLGGHEVAIGAHREPIWPAGVVGSITHCRTMAAAIALRAHTCSGAGIDIEEVIVDSSTRSAILDNIISVRELAYLRQHDLGLSFDVLLTLVFSAKESFYKGAYGSVGRFFGFDAIELARFDPVMQSIEFEVREALSEDFRPGDVVRTSFRIVDDKYVCTTFLW